MFCELIEVEQDHRSSSTSQKYNCVARTTLNPVRFHMTPALVDYLVSIQSHVLGQVNNVLDALASHDVKEHEVSAPKSQPSITLNTIDLTVCFETVKIEATSFSGGKSATLSTLWLNSRAFEIKCGTKPNKINTYFASTTINPSIVFGEAREEDAIDSNTAHFGTTINVNAEHVTALDEDKKTTTVLSVSVVNPKFYIPEASIPLMVAFGFDYKGAFERWKAQQKKLSPEIKQRAHEMKERIAQGGRSFKKDVNLLKFEVQMFEIHLPLGDLPMDKSKETLLVRNFICVFVYSVCVCVCVCVCLCLFVAV